MKYLLVAGIAAGIWVSVAVIISLWIRLSGVERWRWHRLRLRTAMIYVGSYPTIMKEIFLLPGTALVTALNRLIGE